jgi:hypothetical protein
MDENICTHEPSPQQPQIAADLEEGLDFATVPGRDAATVVLETTKRHPRAALTTRAAALAAVLLFACGLAVAITQRRTGQQHRDPQPPRHRTMASSGGERASRTHPRPAHSPRGHIGVAERPSHKPETRPSVRKAVTSPPPPRPPVESPAPVPASETPPAETTQSSEQRQGASPFAP